MGKTVLIIDDSAFMREFIEETLEDEGWDIVGQAGDGDTGIELALELKPDLITLDNVLPDMLGMDIAKVLLIEEKITSKIVMISALGQDDVIAECKAVGVSGYIVKPFEEEDLVEEITKIFG
jgi:two-component system chemotaxis response regulator CheY